MQTSTRLIFNYAYIYIRKIENILYNSQKQNTTCTHILLVYHIFILCHAYFQHQLRDFEEKYKQAMMTNAQLDNTITTQMFQLELLKEQMEEKDESILECQREYKSKTRVC